MNLTHPPLFMMQYDVMLGRGAYKRVYKAFDTEDGLEVAWNKVRASLELLMSAPETDQSFPTTMGTTASTCCRQQTPPTAPPHHKLTHISQSGRSCSTTLSLAACLHAGGPGDTGVGGGPRTPI